MYAIDVLVAEHENVLRLNAVMRAACLSLLEGAAPQVKDFRAFIELIRAYADKHHHGKEELFLFAEMVNHLGPAAQQLVRGGMLVEHDLGRLYVAQMEEALNRWEETEDADSKLDLISNAMAYADLLRRHIQRENDVAYPFAQRSLPADIREQLDRQTRGFEENSENAALRESLLAHLALLERKYLPR